MKSIKIKFWGVRGSIPTPGASTIHYGGNTPCVEIDFYDGPLFIMDAGTGIRELGNYLINKNEPVNAFIFISHFHWDHIQGLPFFRPAHLSGNKFTILGCDDASLKLDQIISFQMDPTYFPIAIEDMKADIQFKSIKEEKIEICGVTIQTIYLNHPGYALGFRMTFQGKSIIYISDNEPYRTPPAKNKNNNLKNNPRAVEEIFNTFVEDKQKNLINFCKHADLLIHDTQYLPEEYPQKVTWGHSPLNFTTDLAVKSEVKELVLFHHDPNHDDATIDYIEKLSRDFLHKSGTSISCQAAKEGLELFV